MTDRTPEHAALLATFNSGELYVDHGPGYAAVEAERAATQERVYDYNATRPSEPDRRAEILRDLLGAVSADAWIEPPFRVAYGSHTRVGRGFYANFGCVVVDDADVWIGDRVMFGPHVTLTTAGHPVAPELRLDGRQFSLPIRIGDDVWLGANVVVLPGVTIGDGTVVGAGSVVTRDLPPRVVAVGSPCRVLRAITDADHAFVRRDRLSG